MTAHITFTGNATGDAELRFTPPNGAAVANVTIAVTPRVKNGDQWEDGDPAFYRVTAWREMAENAAESVKRGNRVTVVGKLKPREFEHNGEKRMSLDVDADSIALDLRWATAQAVKAGRSQPQPTQSQQQQADPWNQSTGGGGWGGQMAQTEEAPF